MISQPTKENIVLKTVPILIWLCPHEYTAVFILVSAILISASTNSIAEYIAISITHAVIFDFFTNSDTAATGVSSIPFTSFVISFIASFSFDC